MPAPALIETIRVRNGVAPLWGLHLARLVESCLAVGVPVPLELATPSGAPDRVHRLLVSSGGVELSQRPVGSEEPLRLVTASVCHSAYPYKTTAREPFDRAQREARAAGADDGVMLVAGGWVAEASVWALFWWKDGRLCGPPIEFGILRSVARRRLEEMMGEVEPSRATPGELPARGLFAANAARGVVPVATFDGFAVAQHPLTGRVAARFWP